MSENVDLSGVKSFSVVRIPKEQFPFMKRNPKLTQIVGHAIMEIHGAEKHIQDIRDVLEHSEDLRAEVEDATPEEVEEFIQAALTGAEIGVMDFDDLPPGVAQEVKNQLGEEMFTTDLGQKFDTSGDLG